MKGLSFNVAAYIALILLFIGEIQVASANDNTQKQQDNGPVIWTNTLVIESDNGQNCTLSYRDDETLWSIAKRYALLWKVNIYAAMLAIYQKNPHAFYQYKINGLLPGKRLLCPSNYLLLSQGNKAEAKAHYLALVNGQ